MDKERRKALAAIAETFSVAAIPRYSIEERGRVERHAEVIEAFFAETDRQSEWGRLMKEVMRVQAEDGCLPEFVFLRQLFADACP